MASQKKITVITQDGTPVQLTPNQKAYADGKLQAPHGTSLIKIAAEAYPNAKQSTLSQIVNQNEKNKSIALYSNEQVEEAKKTVYGLLKSEKDTVKLAAAQDILDRNIGKAIQRTEVASTSLQIGIDLTSMTTEAEQIEE